MLKVTCYGCGNEGHCATACPNVHLVLDQEDIITQFNKEHHKFCYEWRRKPRQRFHVLLNLSELDDAGTHVCRNNPIVIRGLLGNQKLRLKSQVLKRHKLSQPDLDNKRSSSRHLTGGTGGKNTTSFDSIGKEEDERSPVNQFGMRKSGRNFTAVGYGYHEIVNELDEDLEDKSVGSVDKELQDLYYLDSFNKNRFPYQLVRTKTLRETYFPDGFETVKNYPLYFPHNNITKIIESIEQQKIKKNKLQEIKMRVEDFKSEVGKMKFEPPRRASLFGASMTPSARKKLKVGLFPSGEV